MSVKCPKCGSEHFTMIVESDFDMKQEEVPGDKPILLEDFLNNEYFQQIRCFDCATWIDPNQFSEIADFGKTPLEFVKDERAILHEQHLFKMRLEAEMRYNTYKGNDPKKEQALRDYADSLDQALKCSREVDM